MISIEFLGASREVGRSAFLIHTDLNIMADYGVKLFDETGVVKYPLHTNSKPDLAIMSHAHMDHIGTLPALFKENPKMNWYGTPPTKDICEILWMDSMKIMGENLPYNLSHLQRALRNFNPIYYNQPLEFGETRVNFYDAGHISGSSMLDFTYKNKRLLYTGDFKCEETFMHNAAEAVEDVDVIMMESTYAKKEHPPRKETEQNFMDDIEETIDNGGNVLLPAFGLGRTQELLSVIRHYNRDIPVYIDGMGRELTKVYIRYGKYVKDVKKLTRAAESVKMVGSIEDKKEATRHPSVIISTAGMLNGGPALNYLFNMNNKSKIIFTGYCVEGTNGWKLQKHGHITQNGEDLYVDLPVEYYNFSAHAGRSDILKMIKKANPEKVLLVHGDNPQEFARELNEELGFSALAPLPGEKVEIV